MKIAGRVQRRRLALHFAEKHGIKYTKKLGQLFTVMNSSQQIIDMLLGECADAGVEIRLRMPGAAA